MEVEFLGEALYAASVGADAKEVLALEDEVRGYVKDVRAISEPVVIQHSVAAEEFDDMKKEEHGGMENAVNAVMELLRTAKNGVRLQANAIARFHLPAGVIETIIPQLYRERNRFDAVGFQAGENEIIFFNKNLPNYWSHLNDLPWVEVNVRLSKGSGRLLASGEYGDGSRVAYGSKAGQVLSVLFLSALTLAAETLSKKTFEVLVWDGKNTYRVKNQSAFSVLERLRELLSDSHAMIERAA